MRWDREKLPKLDSHVYSENGTKFMVYNMKRNPKTRRRKKLKQEKRKFKKDNSKRKNFIPLITLF